MDDGVTPGGLDRVREIMAQGEDVDLPEGVAAPHPEEWESPPLDPDFGIHDAPPPPEDGGDGGEAPAARCQAFPLNDYGNGLRLVEHFGADLEHVPNAGFFVWDGARFAPDPDGIAVRRRAHRMTELIGQEVWFMPLSDGEAEVLARAERAKLVAEEIGEIDRAKRTDEQVNQLIMAERQIREGKELKEKRDKSVGRRLTHAKNAGNTNAIKNMLTEAGAILARDLDDLDADPLVINTLTGALRFRVAPGEDDGGMYAPPPVVHVDALGHRREDLLTKIMPVGYDPEARAPTWDAFLERIQPQPAMRAFLRRWCGLGMTALTGEQKFAVFYGSGANGKSVLVDLLARLMGDYAASAKIESITGRTRRGGGDATPDLMPLVGARFVRTSEPDAGERLQEGLIKELTGGEPILVRPPYGVNFLTVYPHFKLTISTNHRPEIHGGDDGIWRRVLLVPFDVQIPPDERDPDLPEKLWAERAGILNWLIDGLRDYLAHGLQVPEAVLAATAEYREDSDPLGTFLTECCGVSGNPDHTLSSKRLCAAFAFWQREQGGGAWTPRTIQNRVKARAGRWKHPKTGQVFSSGKSSVIVYQGIDLVSPFRELFEEHELAEARREARWRGGSDD